VKESGADILRLWVASSDYHEDVRCSEEILERTVDAYRKIRNTARYALGNLNGFDVGRDTVATPALFEIDRWVLAELDGVVAEVRKAFEAYEFHMATRAIYGFCTITLSARYFDIIKDRLYTAAPRSLSRRSAQTALYRIADSLARMLAPILVFTSDEIWENLPHHADQAVSVHVTDLPHATEERNAQLLARWNKLFVLRDQVLAKLEEAREKKLIGSSLEARVVIRPSALDEDLEFLKEYEEQLRYIFIVSQVEIASPGENMVVPQIEVHRAAGKKCERCWNYSTHVGESVRYPDVCERCVAALEEIEQENQRA
jgi:isoleucyl-tRNA synthetase